MPGAETAKEPFSATVTAMGNRKLSIMSLSLSLATFMAESKSMPSFVKSATFFQIASKVGDDVHGGCRRDLAVAGLDRDEPNVGAEHSLDINIPASHSDRSQLASIGVSAPQIAEANAHRLEAPTQGLQSHGMQTPSFFSVSLKALKTGFMTGASVV